MFTCLVNLRLSSRLEEAQGDDTVRLRRLYIGLTSSVLRRRTTEHLLEPKKVLRCVCACVCVCVCV